MKLSYWYARCLNDGDCYSIRTRTKKEAQARREEYGEANYAEPVRVEVEYTDGFDLMHQCSCEGANWWENSWAAR